ncbi:hypothetical protein Trydic_g13914 [Trypoxylus dichotomus]
MNKIDDLQRPKSVRILVQVAKILHRQVMIKGLDMATKKSQPRKENFRKLFRSALEYGNRTKEDIAETVFVLKDLNHGRLAPVTDSVIMFDFASILTSIQNKKYCTHLY